MPSAPAVPALMCSKPRLETLAIFVSPPDGLANEIFFANMWHCESLKPQREARPSFAFNPPEMYADRLPKSSDVGFAQWNFPARTDRIIGCVCVCCFSGG